MLTRQVSDLHYVLEEKRTKFEPFSLKGILVGYDESFKAYKFYVPSQRKIVVNQDVKVDEDAWSSMSQEPPVLIEETTLTAPSVDPWGFRSSSVGQIG